MRTRDKMEVLAETLEERGVRLVLGENYLDSFDDDYIFRSPGIRPDKGSLPNAVANGAVLTSEMELFFEICPCKIIGITGSDGKTTTTTLISEILRESGKKVWLGGNIGRPLLPDADKMKEDDICVVELSSFQLMTMTRSPERAVVTNISPNHLDYHKDINEYIDAKKNIYRNPGNVLLVTNASNPHTALMAEEHKGENLLFSSKADADVCIADGVIRLKGEPVLKISDIRLPGVHNVENYMAAIAATRGLADIKAIQKVAKTFGGVEHRLEFIRELRGVKYYNSSIDSTPTRTIAALGAFTGRSLIVICGGYDKNLDYAPLAPELAKKAKAVVLSGKCAPKIKAALDGCELIKTNGTKIYEIPDLLAAASFVPTIAERGDTVLLSPAAASFDAFKNFEERGRAFKQIIKGLK